VQWPPKIKQGRGKWATLPGHHLPDGNLALENKPDAVRCKVLLREFGLDELLDIGCKILRQNGMCAAEIGTEAQSRERDHEIEGDVPSTKRLDSTC